MGHASFRFGFAVIAGKPNVGKSSLVNVLTSCKTSIISRRPQTTRNRIVGIVNKDSFQLAVIDTPGIHDSPHPLNKRIDNIARKSIQQGDVVVMVIDARGWREEDDLVWNILKHCNRPLFIVINKVDLLSRSSELLPLISKCSKLGDIAEIIPISVKTGHNMDRLLDLLQAQLPLGEPGFSMTDSNVSRLELSVAELIREQIFRFAGAELPYRTAVVVNIEANKGSTPEYQADIWVETTGQKAILIGKSGVRLKVIGIKARQEIETFVGHKVVLLTRVLVRKGWSSNQSDLNKLGYGNL